MFLEYSQGKINQNIVHQKLSKTQNYLQEQFIRTQFEKTYKIQLIAFLNFTFTHIKFKQKITMYQSQPYHNQNTFSKQSINSFNQLNPSTIDLKSKDIHLKITLTKLINDNDDLKTKLQQQKQKNYSLFQLKTKLQDEIHKLQFQLNRIASYQNLTNKQTSIRNNQITNDNSKLKSQLDNYLQENKQIRGELRKWMNKYEQLNKQKQNLINQNVLLLKQINQLKQNISSSKNQINKLKTITSNRSNYFCVGNQINTATSIKQQLNPQKKYFIKENSYIQSTYSPKSKITPNYQFNQNGQISTNHSLNKISVNSPSLLIIPQNNINGKICNELNTSPSPRNAINKVIHQHIQFISPCKQPTQMSLSSNSNLITPYLITSNQRTSYQNNENPIIQKLKLNPHPINNQLEYLNNNQLIEGYQKKQLKNEVTILRNQLIDSLINQYYVEAINKAQQDKSNSLKIFMESLSSKLDILVQMVKNYLQAKQMMTQSCPSLRLKWQPISSTQNCSTTSQQFLIKNTINLSNIYQSIKQSSKKQQSEPGQYLTLFRFLTLLSKLEQEVDPLLVDCIKNSALEQICQIKKYKDGELPLNKN